MPRKRRSEDVDGFVSTASPIKIKIEQFMEDKSSFNNEETTVNLFAEDTSMLGFRYLHTRYKTWFRVLWACVLIFFIGLTLYQVFERITYYFIANPLSTRRSYETLPKMYFPTIGVCNKMQMKASAVASINPELLRSLCNFYNDKNNISHLEDLERFNDVDILSIHRTSFQSADDLFVSCEFGKSGSCQDEIRPMFTPNGLCFSVSPNKTILRPGPETTLSLVLNLEVHDIIPGAIVEPGVILSIYDDANSLSHYSEGIHLEAGKVVTIPVNEVRKLKRYSTSCGTTKMESFSEKEYSKAACEWSANVKQIEKQCGCIPARNPIYRSLLTNPEEYFNSSTKNEIPKKKKKKQKIAKCTLRQEVECVQEKLNIRPTIDPESCPEDCEDISFSSIVFGGKLSPSEIISLLPSDWEDTKEKRVSAYQKALEVIPNRMIPVVRNVQELANELQGFVREALEIFGFADKLRSASDVKCFSHDGRSYESLINQFNAHEPIWERITTYLQRSLARELNTTANCIGIGLDTKGKIINIPNPVLNMSLASISLLQLGEIENSLGKRNFNFGLNIMHEITRKTVLDLAHPLIKEVKECLTKMYDNLDRVEEIAEDCRIIFKNRYKPLIEASNVYTESNPTSPLISNFMVTIRKVISKLHSMKTSVRMSEWKDFDIDLKEFESLYKETAKDHVEIEDLLKMRKTIITDIPEMANQLAELFKLITESRRKFSILTGIIADESWSQKFLNSTKCLMQIHEMAPLLKKHRFVRGEWLSRLRDQVLMAQSYSPTHQYDVVNLLHIKFYFAHFKQETIIQEKSYNMFLLLAEIGGTIGLYVGATLLTVAETLVFFFERKAKNWFLKPQWCISSNSCVPSKYLCHPWKTVQNNFNCPIKNVPTTFNDTFNRNEISNYILAGNRVNEASPVGAPMSCLLKISNNVEVRHEVVIPMPIDSRSIAYLIAINHDLKQIVLAFRSTNNLRQLLFQYFIFMMGWMEDFPLGGKMVAYYVMTYNLIISNNFNQYMDNLVAEFPNYSIICTGHSLGGSMATGLALHTAIRYPSIKVILYSWSAPRSGDEQFSRMLQEHIHEHYRVVFDLDPIPDMPMRISQTLDTPHHGGIEVFYNHNMEEYTICNQYETEYCIKGSWIKTPIAHIIMFHKSYFDIAPDYCD